MKNQVRLPRIGGVLMCALLLMLAGGCASNGVVGRWAVDAKSSHYLLFGAASQPAESDRELRERSTQLQSKMDQLTTQRIAAISVLFLSKGDSQGYAGDCDGVYAMLQGDQGVAWGRWKKAAPQKGEMESGAVYDMYQANSSNRTFVAQGQFIVEGKTAKWRLRLGDYGGMTFVLHPVAGAKNFLKQ